MQVGHYSFVIIKSTETFWDVYVILVFVVFGFYCTSFLACMLSLTWYLSQGKKLSSTRFLTSHRLMRLWSLFVTDMDAQCPQLNSPVTW